MTASLAKEKRGVSSVYDYTNRQILDNTLKEAKKISDTVGGYPESTVVDFAQAVTELARAYALKFELGVVEQLFHKIPRQPRSEELDYILAQMAYLLADLSIKKGFLDKAASIYREHFPQEPCLGSELIRLDLASLLVNCYLDRDLLDRAKDLFFSYFQNNEIQYFCPVPEHLGKFARGEYTRLLTGIAQALYDYSHRNEHHDTLSQIERHLESCSELEMLLKLRLNHFRKLEKQIVGEIAQ